MPFDLPAYLARIGLPLAPEPDAEGLATLQRAHRLAIAFENLDVILGRGISLDPQAVFAKLVTSGRGGWCFEQNRLFLDALVALGFDARPLLARVWLGRDDVPARTHTLILVTIGGAEWIADAGFGGSHTPPLPLIDGSAAVSPDGAHHRLRHDAEYGWMLERDGHPGLTDGRETRAGWQRQYSFTAERVLPVDLEQANFYTATLPGRFTRTCLVSIVLPNGFARLTDRHYARRAGDRATEGEIADARTYRLRLSLMFGLHLTADEVAGLGLF